MEHELNTLGKAVNDKGEVVMQMFSAPSALTKGADAISQGLYLLSETLIRGLNLDAGHGFLGGEFGYGVDFENDVFSMYPDYMDVQCKCGFDNRVEPLWTEWDADYDHKIDCYYSVLNAKIDAYSKKIGWSWEVDDPDYKLMDKRRKYENRTMTILCKQYGVDREYGAAVHCTCGYKQERKTFADTLGKHESQCPIVRPNFLHKATGFEVEWYKWIGRDVVISDQSITGKQWVTIYEECLASLPQEARDKAEAEYAYENTPEYKAKENEAMDRMFKAVRSFKLLTPELTDEELEK